MTIRGIRCRRCGDKLWTRHAREFRQCGCGAVALDGLRVAGRLVDFETVDIEAPELGTGKEGRR